MRLGEAGRKPDSLGIVFFLTPYRFRIRLKVRFMVNIPQLEEEILKFWNENNIFQKSLTKESPKGEYVFYDGPPFVTGTPHYGSILGSVIKDVMGRYWTMRGYHVARRWGWDCHGLPIENMVEKQLGLKHKKEIETLGVDKFNNLCRTAVEKISDDWWTVIERIGRWVEFKNAYRTMDNTYIESVWWAFKTMWDKGLVYEGRKVLLYCPRCETPIAKAEIAMDNSYQDIDDFSTVYKFRVKGQQNTYLLAWSTTPWNKLNTYALAVSPSLEYVKVRVGGEVYILAKSRIVMLKTDQYEIVETCVGKDLVGLEYEPLYDFAYDFQGKKVYIVIDAEFVSDEEGTGIVTIAPYGEEDIQTIETHGLPVVLHLDSQGRFVDAVTPWRGMFFRDADTLIIDDLKEKNLIYWNTKEKHNYPFCYRCHTQLYYCPVQSWFLNIQKLKPRLLKLNEQLHWHPDHFQHGRFQKSVESAPDWTISRNRYWASSIPVWRSDDGAVTMVIGSVKELQQYATTPVPDIVDLHKDSVDKIELKDPQSGKILRRIPEVFDCWIESASMPFAAVHYPFENQEWFEKNFPAQFIAEYTGQIRTWFYYMLVISAALFDKIPFENIVVTGVLLAEDGTKMSKSKGNYPDPSKFFQEYGVDGMRYFMMASPLMNAEDASFSTLGIKEKLNTLNILLNVVTFYNTFAGNQSVGNVQEADLKHVMDRWICAKLNILIREMTEKFDRYDITGATRGIGEFINELSTWYVRRSRDRFKTEGEDKQFALATLRHVLIELSKLMAPVMPFIADQVYRTFGRATESVHLLEWPETHPESDDEKILLLGMDQVRTIVSLTLEQRAAKGLPIRQPLSKVTVRGVDFKVDDEYFSLITDEVNVKEVVIEPGEGGLAVELDTTISEELKKEGLVREITRLVNDLRKKQGLTIKDLIIVEYSGDSYLEGVIDEFQEQLKKVTLAKEWKKGDGEGQGQVLLALKDSKLAVSLRR